MWSDLCCREISRVSTRHLDILDLTLGFAPSKDIAFYRNNHVEAIHIPSARIHYRE